MKWCLFGSAAVLLATFCHAKEDAFTYRYVRYSVASL